MLQMQIFCHKNGDSNLGVESHMTQIFLCKKPGVIETIATHQRSRSQFPNWLKDAISESFECWGRGDGFFRQFEFHGFFAPEIALNREKKLPNIHGFHGISRFWKKPLKNEK